MAFLRTGTLKYIIAKNVPYILVTIGEACKYEPLPDMEELKDSEYQKLTKAFKDE